MCYRWPAGWAPRPLHATDEQASESAVPAAVWSRYANGRPTVAQSPALQAAAIIVNNRQAILKDAQRRQPIYSSVPFMHGAASGAIDEALRAIVSLLVSADGAAEGRAKATAHVAAVAAYLDERTCVPRDMGGPPAAELHRLRVELCAAVEPKV